MSHDHAPQKRIICQIQSHLVQIRGVKSEAEVVTVVAGAKRVRRNQPCASTGTLRPSRRGEGRMPVYVRTDKGAGHPYLNLSRPSSDRPMPHLQYGRSSGVEVRVSPGFEV